MDSIQEEKFSRFKLAQLWHFVNHTDKISRNSYLHNGVVNRILEDDFDVNTKVTVIPYQKPKIHLKNCTALHFLYYGPEDIDSFKSLLEHGADFTLKNENGQTALHLVITNNKKIKDDDVPFIKSVISAHVKVQNFLNPRDNDGVSHLHAACIINHVEAAELFLDNGASEAEVINFDAPKYAGYTPLHFAAAFHNFEVAQTLVSRGANVNAQTAERKTPLDVLVQQKGIYHSSKVRSLGEEQLIKLLLEKGGISNVGLSSLHVALTLHDLTVARRILNQGVDVDYAVPMTSPVRAGNTALHFAADNSIEAVEMLLICGAKIDVANAKGWTLLDICVERCGIKNTCKVLSCIDNWKEILLSDGETRLLDLISSMKNVEHFKLFLQNLVKDVAAVVPSDSPILPGYTILHLAVTFSRIFDTDSATYYEMVHEKTVIEECLIRGLSLNAQNARGQTPIHLAFYQDKRDVVGLFLERLNEPDQIADIVDEDNLSYLHIACAMENDTLVEKLLRTVDASIAYGGERIDNESIQPGSTPLHLAVAKESHTIAETLLRRGANLHAIDAKGLIPIHWLARHIWLDVDPRIGGVLLDALADDPKERVIEGVGLTYLHVASFYDHARAVEALLDLGSDVNAIIEYEELPVSSPLRRVLGGPQRYAKYTPLQTALAGMNPEAVLDPLLRRGADAFPTRAEIDKCTRLDCIPMRHNHTASRFFQALWDDERMQRCMEERFGLTKLHVACYLKNEEAVRSALNGEIDVDARVKADAEIFAGCTPLHMLVMIVDSDAYPVLMEFTIGSIVSLLVDRGADVTLVNSEEDTPIHVFNKHQDRFIDQYICKKLLLNAQRDFSANPVNTEGQSHFHLACEWLQDGVVEKFLVHRSVDVNQPIDCFAKRNAGCTPLHLALILPTSREVDWTKLSQTVDVLLKHGADVAARDVNGDTPLHKPAVLKSPEMSILKKLVSYGGDINSVNIQGSTPIEVCSGQNANLADYITIFQKHDYKFNSHNHLTGEGYIAKIFLSDRRDNLSKNPEFERFLQSNNVTTVDNKGRTAIHNSVAMFVKYVFDEEIKNYTYAIENFIKLDIDIDHQDKSGQTALHCAARMENVIGVEALLKYGADINIVDADEKSALSYAMEHSNKKGDLHQYCQKNVTLVLRLYIKKLQYLGIGVSQLNEELVESVQHIFDNPVYELESNDFHSPPQIFFSQIEMTKAQVIGTDSLTLFDFLSDAGAVNSYSFWPKCQKNLVDDFFKSIAFEEFDEIIDIIKLQYRKMKTRLALIDSALGSLRTLLGFSVPGLCEQISLFLTNSDLNNLLKSTTLKTRKRKISEISN